MAEEKVGTSIVLAADDPAVLAVFYGRLLGVEPQAGLGEQHWRLPWPAGGFLELYAPSRSRPQPRQSGRLAPCLQRQATGRHEAIAVLEAWVREATLSADIENWTSSFGCRLTHLARGRLGGCATARALRGGSLASGSGRQPPAAAGDHLSRPGDR